MRCPTLRELPPPPRDKTGWPWTEESPQLPNALPDGRPWPTISIVTPSYNQGLFLEETIRSVLLQGYPNLEYIVIDGASSDDSLKIIEKYASWIAFWTSEPDDGPSHAIAKGFSRATGSVFSWLNSDDVLLPMAAGVAASLIVKGMDVAYGHRLRISEDGFVYDFDIAPKSISRLMFCTGTWLPQETVFFSRSIYERAHGINEKNVLDFDYDLWIRMYLHGARFKNSGVFMGMARFHKSSIQARRAGELWESFRNTRSIYLGSHRVSSLLVACCDKFLMQIIFRLWQLRKRYWRLVKRVVLTERGYQPAAVLTARAFEVDGSLMLPPLERWP
jgi:glycosyltransferase involved in cell wall biosynthesis